MTSRTDAVIIGGGPAGAVAAVLLARRGWAVLLVERGERFRSKPCGHCLSARGCSLLNQLGLCNPDAAAMTAASNSTRSLAIHIPDQDALNIRLDARSAPGLIVNRSTFDQLLRDEAASAGAHVWYSAQARALPAEASVEIRCHDVCVQVRTPLVIGADGLGSSVARAFGLEHKHCSLQRGYGFAVDLRSNSAACDSLTSDEIAMFVVRDGYVGIVQPACGVIHAAAMVRPSTHRKPARPMEFLHQAACVHPTLRELGFDRVDADTLRSLQAVGPMPWRTRKVAAASASGGVALLGDAAGYIEPFTGQGMQWAIESALALDNAVKDCRPGCWGAAQVERYRSFWRGAVQHEQLMCAAISRILKQPRLLNLAAAASQRLPGLARFIAERAVAA